MNIIYILTAYAVLTVLPHLLGPRPRFREWPDPLVDWVFGVGVVLALPLQIFEPRRKKTKP